MFFYPTGECGFDKDNSYYFYKAALISQVIKFIVEVKETILGRGGHSFWSYY